MKAKVAMKKIIFLSVVALSALCWGCQEDPIEMEGFGRLEGRLLDENTFAPIEGAVVTTVPATDVFISDSTGRFSIDSLSEDSYTIRVNVDGYREGIQNVSIEADRTREATILMAQEEEEENVAPSAPANPSPADGAQGLEPTVKLVWSDARGEADDTIRYDLLLYSSQSLEGQMVAEGLTDTTFTVEQLEYGTTYFWQVKADNGEFAPVYSPTWAFSVRPFPDYRYHYVRRDSATGELGIYTGTVNDFGGNNIEEILLTEGLGDCWKPRMSPDRQKVAFLSFSGTQVHLFTMGRDGSDVQQVTDEVPVMSYDSEKIDYAWSPNSGQLLYMNFNKAYKINADGTGLTEFAEAPSGRAFTGMDWSSHPNHVVARVRGNNHYEDELYLINAQGALQPLRADEPGALGNPMFSVDGTQVLYSYDQSGSQNPNGRLIDMQLFIMEVDNPSDTRMLDAQKQEGTNDIEARFSSTGGKIICTNVPNDGIAAPIIYQIDIDGIDRSALFAGASMADMR